MHVLDLSQELPRESAISVKALKQSAAMGLRINRLGDDSDGEGEQHRSNVKRPRMSIG